MRRRTIQVTGVSVVLLVLTAAGIQAQSAVVPRGTTQTESRASEKAGPEYAPEVTIQSEDYAKARARFRTKLLRKSPAPQNWTPLTPPAGVTQVEFPSGPLHLKAWVNRPAADDHHTYPAVLFLHGGFAFDLGDWKASQPYRDAGYI